MHKRRDVSRGGRPLPLLTTSQAAKLLNLSLRHLRRLKETRALIPAYRVHIERVGAVDLWTFEQIRDYAHKTGRPLPAAPSFLGADPVLRDRRRRMKKNSRKGVI